MKRTKDYEHNLKRICAEIRYDFKQWQDIQGNGMTWRKKGRKLKWLECKLKGTWKEDEKENETNGKGNQRNIRWTWKNKRKGGKFNKVNVKQRYDWRKWKVHGSKWKETDRRIKTHERNATRNEREMARTRKETFLCGCVFDFFQIHTYKMGPPWWPRSCIPNSLSVRFWTWHGGTMKGYEQIMEGHENNAHERKVDGNEMHLNKVE